MDEFSEEDNESNDSASHHSQPFRTYQAQNSSASIVTARAPVTNPFYSQSHVPYVSQGVYSTHLSQTQQTENNNKHLKIVDFGQKNFTEARNDPAFNSNMRNNSPHMQPHFRQQAFPAVTDVSVQNHDHTIVSVETSAMHPMLSNMREKTVLVQPAFEGREEIREHRSTSTHTSMPPDPTTQYPIATMHSAITTVRYQTAPTQATANPTERIPDGNSAIGKQQYVATSSSSSVGTTTSNAVTSANKTKAPNSYFPTVQPPFSSTRSVESASEGHSKETTPDEVVTTSASTQDAARQHHVAATYTTTAPHKQGYTDVTAPSGNAIVSSATSTATITATTTRCEAAPISATTSDAKSSLATNVATQGNVFAAMTATGSGVLKPQPEVIMMASTPDSSNVCTPKRVPSDYEFKEDFYRQSPVANTSSVFATAMTSLYGEPPVDIEPLAHTVFNAEPPMTMGSPLHYPGSPAPHIMLQQFRASPARSPALSVGKLNVTKHWGIYIQKFPAHAPSYGTQFFTYIFTEKRLCRRFTPPNGPTPPTGNPGSATTKCHVLLPLTFAFLICN